MSNRYLSSAFASGLPPLGGPAELELNAVLTTSGHVSLAEGAVTYVPGLDARLLGRSTLVIPVADLRAVSRRDGYRRVVLEVGSQEFVLRGVGAQRVWVGIMALRDERHGDAHRPPMVFEEEAAYDDELNGLYGLGANGYGYSSRLPVGLVVSYWEELGALRSIRTEPELLVRGVEERAVRGVGAAAFVAALIDRWLEAPAVTERAAGWRTAAAWITDAEVFFGALTVETEGVVFTPVDGAARVLVARGGRSVARLRAEDERELHLEDDSASHRLRAPDAPAVVASLTGLFTSGAWRVGTTTLLHQALPDDQITLLYGACSSGSLTHQGVVVATAGRQLLKPNAYEVELDVRADASALPPVPFPCDLQVANARGLFGVRGVAAAFTPRAPESGDDPSRGQRLTALVRFRGEVLPTNRRAYFRLGVEEAVRRVELVVGAKARVLTRAASLLNVSRGGCRLAVPAEPDLDSTCVLHVECDEHLATVSGRVINVSPVDRETWQVGVEYSPESHETGRRVFQERQTAFLRKRHGG